MARLEDLIKDIADPSLRNQIAAEVSKLKAGITFGLLFEEHLPEVVELPNLTIKRGARVFDAASSQLSIPSQAFGVVKAELSLKVFQ